MKKRFLSLGLTASLLASSVVFPGTPNVRVLAADDVVADDVVAEITEPDSQEAPGVTETLFSSDWWSGQGVGSDFVMKQGEAIEFAVTLSSEYGVGSYGAFCVELLDSEGHYITTGSNKDAWYAGEGVSGDAITGVSEYLSSSISTGHTYHVSVIRNEQNFTITYYYPDGRIYNQFVAANTNLSDTVNVHFMAQIGEYTVVQRYVSPDKSYAITDNSVYVLNNESGIVDKQVYQGLLEAADSNWDGILTVEEAKNYNGWVSISIYEQNDVDFTNLSVYAPNIENLYVYAFRTEVDWEYVIDTTLDVGDLNEIAKLTKLKTLHITDAKIEDIKILKELTNLRELVITDCSDITDISFINADNFPELTNLTIYDNYGKMEIAEVPDGIATLTKLTSLHLTRLKIRKLPNLTGLDNLETLNLNSNYLTREELVNHVPAKFAEDEEWLNTNVNEGYDPTTDEYYPENRVAITNDSNGIPDSALYAKLLLEGDQNLGNADGVLTLAEARKIIHLSLGYDNKVVDYTNFAKYVPNLQYLSVSADDWNTKASEVFAINTVTQATEIAKNTKDTFINEFVQLKKLMTFDLWNTYNAKLDTVFIENIAKATQLTYLDMTLSGDSQNQIDLSSLAALVNLHTLNLSGSNFSNLIQAINGMSSLQNLYVSVNDGFKLSELDNKIKEQIITMSLSFPTTTIWDGETGTSKLTTYSVDVTGFKNLGSLSLYGYVDNVIGLENLTSLYSCHMDTYSNDDFSVEYLKRFPKNITYLYLYNVNVEKLSNTNICELTNLHSLTMKDTNLKDIAGIHILQDLSTLQLDRNELTSLKALSGLSKLDYLSVSGNKLASLTGIEECDLLYYIDADENELTDIQAVKDLVALNYLYLEYNELTDIQAVKNLVGLYALHLEHNKLTNISVVTNLTELRRLHIAYNELAVLPNMSQMTNLTIDENGYWTSDGEYQQSIFGNLTLRGNKLTKETLIGFVPAEFSSDNQWVMEALQWQTANGRLYYKQLTQKQMLSKMSYEEENISYSYYVDNSCSIETSSDFYKFIQKYGHVVNVYFINPEFDGNSDYQYDCVIRIYGKLLAEDVSNMNGITLTNIVKVLDKQNVIEEKYKEVFPEAKDDIDIFYFELNQEYPTGVTYCVCSDWFAEKQVDEDGYVWYQGKDVDVYFYDKATQQSQLIEPDVWIFNRSTYQMIGSDRFTEHAEYWNKTAEKGYYYLVENTYNIYDDIPVWAVPKGVELVDEITGDYTITERFGETTDGVELKVGDSYTFKFHNKSNGTETNENYIVGIISTIGKHYYSSEHEVFMTSANEDSWFSGYTYGSRIISSNIEDWDAWNAAMQAGVDCEVTVARLNERYISYTAKQGEYEVTVYVYLYDVPENSYVFFTGENCELTGFTTEKNTVAITPMATTSPELVETIAGNYYIEYYGSSKTPAVKLESGDSYTFKFHTSSDYSRGYALGISGEVGENYRSMEEDILKIYANMYYAGGGMSDFASHYDEEGNLLEFEHNIEDWDAWYEKMYEGVDCEVTITRDGNTLVYDAVQGDYKIHTTATSGVDLPDVCYVFFGGSYCWLTDIKTYDNNAVAEETTTKEEPVSEQETTTQKEPVSEQETTTQKEPASEQETTTKKEPASEQETTTKKEPASEQTTTVVQEETTTLKGSKAETIKPSEIVKKEEAKEKILTTMANTILPVVETIVDAAITLTNDIFETMKKESKDLTVGVVNEDNELQYEWTFNHREIDADKLAAMKDLDLSITFETDKKKEIEAITGQKEAFYISFAYHGDLPAPATIKTYVGTDYKDGEVVYLYYYNEEDGKIESINGAKGLVVEKGYVTYTITHCSVYFLSVDTPDAYGIEINPSVSSEPDTSDASNTQLYFVLVCVSVIVAVSVKRRRRIAE